MRVSKRLVVAFAAPVMLLLVAARLQVFPVPDTLADDPAARLHQNFTARPGDVILRGRILHTQASMLDAPVKVAIARFSDTIAAGDELTPVLAPSATSDLVGGSGAYYCGRNQRSRSGFAEAMIGSLGSKFEPVVRFCFIDSDNDHKLDKVFLAGAKDKQFQAAVPIDPVAFHSTYFKQLNAEDEVRLRYRKFNPTSGKIELALEIHRAGQDESFDYIVTPRNGAADRQYRLIATNPKKLNYPMHFTDILGADIGIESVQPDGTATFVLNRNFRMSLFRPVSIQVQTIYVYVYHG